MDKNGLCKGKIFVLVLLSTYIVLKSKDDFIFDPWPITSIFPFGIPSCFAIIACKDY